MQGSNIFYKRENRFTSHVKFVGEEYNSFDFNNNLKSNKIEQLEFTNYLSSNQCKKYYILLEKQLLYLNTKREELYKKIVKFYNLYTRDNLDKNLSKRVCNFKLLEEKCLEYHKIKV